MSGEASRPRPSPWPFATGSRSPGSERGLLVPPTPPRSRARGPGRLRSPRSSSRPPPARGVHAGGGLKRGRRRAGLPSPRPRRLLPSSRLARSSRHRPSRGRRAKWRPSGRLARRRRQWEPGRGARDAPRPTAPATVSATTLRRGALCPGGFSGPAWRGAAVSPGPPTTTGEGGRKEEEGGRH